jgi:orotate phosphoribosyltransferase
VTGPAASPGRSLEALLLEKSVRRGDFVLASGARSSYYIDCRLTTMSAEGMVLVGRLGLAAIRGAGWAPKGVGGLTMGADPVAYAIAAASWQDPPAIDAFSVRKEVKGHGTRRRIEGNFPEGIALGAPRDEPAGIGIAVAGTAEPGAPATGTAAGDPHGVPAAPGQGVVVIEDVITSGGSALQAIEAVEGAGARVLGVLAVVDREQGGREAIEAAGHYVVALTTSTRLGLA